MTAEPTENIYLVNQILGKIDSKKLIELMQIRNAFSFPPKMKSYGHFSRHFCEIFKGHSLIVQNSANRGPKNVFRAPPIDEKFNFDEKAISFT